MNVKQKFENLKSKVRENRPQIVATISTVATVVLTIALVDANRKLEEATDAMETSNDAMRGAVDHFKNHRTIRLAVGECAFDALKNGESIIWNTHSGHDIDLAYDPEAVCEEHAKHTKPIDTSEV